jgi:hypothetical protein
MLKAIFRAVRRQMFVSSFRRAIWTLRGVGVAVMPSPATREIHLSRDCQTKRLDGVLGIPAGTADRGEPSLPIVRLYSRSETWSRSAVAVVPSWLVAFLVVVKFDLLWLH